MKKQQGFTLIELMIVVAIIGVLSAIAIPAYKNYVTKSEVASGLATLKALITPAEMIYQEKGTLVKATALTDLGITDTANNLGAISLPEDNQIQLLFGTDSSINGAKLVFVRGTDGWACTRTPAAGGALPEIDGCK
ncbi:pilin [Photobacterium phosphoreum]|uniref:pilin n=1 Tax=Photobacterium phosphoreum TaxID=659 RepID=UPI0005D3FBA6|nr:prepilin-type N-terminal cleavage/methylation domain-containing protein [Photobacterium phosphoreum]KJF87689.1 pilus assembly protein PilA [Photobacterium phosphoreum]PQJ92065.1 pilus assembly protein PilA [Photobacterium phosphoreum]PSV71703.1 prepilin-type N-terminal cleavage/methylation domain-containing protein [Photobacterium phosphoreum]